MKVNKFITKLFKGCAYTIEQNYDTYSFSIHEIPIKKLQDNMDLLARELHMEVETMATKTYNHNKKIRHQKIGPGLNFEKEQEPETELKWKNI